MTLTPSAKKERREGSYTFPYLTRSILLDQTHKVVLVTPPIRMFHLVQLINLLLVPY